MRNDTAIDTAAHTRQFIVTLFETVAYEGFGHAFLDHLDDDIIWHATGTSPLGGITTSKQAYQEKVLGALTGKLKTTPIPIVDRIFVDGEWATLLFHTENVEALNGMDFGMEYCWLLKVQADKIVEVVGFYDQKKLHDLFASD